MKKTTLIFIFLRFDSFVSFINVSTVNLMVGLVGGWGVAITVDISNHAAVLLFLWKSIKKNKPAKMILYFEK